jgi:hypothetical protein
MLITVKAEKSGILSANGFPVSLSFGFCISGLTFRIPSSAKHYLMHAFGNELHYRFLALTLYRFGSARLCTLHSCISQPFITCFCRLNTLTVPYQIIVKVGF